MYEEASRVEQHDSDIFSVLGVLYNLSRQYDMAETAFSRALEVWWWGGGRGEGGEKKEKKKGGEEGRK